MLLKKQKVSKLILLRRNYLSNKPQIMFTQDTRKKYTLFICKANVWRSQMAEGIYNHIHWKWMALSLAGCEARKDTYAWKPAGSIQDFMISYAWIDISNQKICYLSDLSENKISEIEKIIFLYDPTKEILCESECMKNELSPYEYFRHRNIHIQIFPIPDPFEEWEMWYGPIYRSINSLISSL